MEFVSVIVIFYVLKGFLFHMQYAYIGMPFFFCYVKEIFCSFIELLSYSDRCNSEF